jgi:hypothetical protein
LRAFHRSYQGNPGLNDSDKSKRVRKHAAKMAGAFNWRKMAV